MTSKQRLRELPKAIIKWYAIEKESRVACIVSEDGNSSLIAEALEEDGQQAERLSLDELESVAPVQRGVYDLVIAVDVLEYAKDAPALFR